VVDTQPEPAAVAETHISVVVFVGDRAYKLKKPVSFGFLDFSTRELREQACHREVALNRRLAPDVYEGVADVTGPDGRPWDHLVVMRRLPADRRLSTLVTTGVDVADHLRELARLVAAFHAAADRSPEIDDAATPASVSDWWTRNLGEMRRFAGSLLPQPAFEEVQQLARRYVAGRRHLFERRIEHGAVVDGHGDLLADDVFCLDDGPRAIDCIEFDDRLRHNDVLADVAFLAMDLERLGAPALAGEFLAAYREFAGETWPDSLVHHYLAQRAVVRAKVTALRVDQGDADAADLARRFLELAHEHLAAGRVRLVLVGGLPGTGKSTLSGALSDAAGWVLLRSDEVRKDAAGIGHEQSAAAGYLEGLYSHTHTVATYNELLERARTALELGESVVLDASWTDARERSAAAALADDVAADLVALRCDAPRELAAERVDARARRGGDASDASAAVAAAMAADADPWPAATVVDTTGTPDEALSAALDAVGPTARGAHRPS